MRILPFWYTDGRGTRNSLAGLVLLLHPASSLGCPSCELHLSTKGTPSMASEPPQRLALAPAQLRTVSTPRNVPCPTCPLVPSWCIINRSMREGTPPISSETPKEAPSSASSTEDRLDTTKCPLSQLSQVSHCLTCPIVS